MPGLTRPLRARSLALAAGALLGCAGLAAAGMESLAFGHQHLSDGGSVHHHHLYCGAHEHADDVHTGPDQTGPDHHGHEAPDPEPEEDRGAPRRTATVSAAPVLFQPAGASVLPAPVTDSTPVALAPAPPRVAHHGIQPSSPRGPPKGSSRCRR